jgi:hypothetical protein
LLLLVERDSPLPHPNVFRFQDYLQLYYNTKSSATESAFLMTGLQNLHVATLSEILELILHLKVHYNVQKSILMDTLMTEKNKVHLHILLV